MPLVAAWHCDHTDEFFLDKSLYQHHLKLMARKRLEQRKQDAYEEMIEDRLQAMRDECNSFEDIAHFIETNPLLFMTARYDRRPGFLERARKFTIVDVRFVKMVFNKSVGITHSAPIGKATNWGSQPDLPRGYPGYSGRIEYRVPFEDHSFRTSFRGTGINTEGGGGGNEFRYDVKLFCVDWKYMLREQTMARLKGEW